MGSNREHEITFIGSLGSIAVVRNDHDRPVATIQLAFHDRAVPGQLCSRMFRSRDEPTMLTVDPYRPAASWYLSTVSDHQQDQ